jgi:acetoin utilization protein AcuB
VELRRLAAISAVDAAHQDAQPLGSVRCVCWLVHGGSLVAGGRRSEMSAKAVPAVRTGASMDWAQSLRRVAGGRNLCARFRHARGEAAYGLVGTPLAWVTTRRKERPRMNTAAAMTRRVICISPDDSLEDAYALMTEWSIRHLTVVNEGQLVGVLSDRDVLRFMVRMDGVERVPALPVGAAMTTRPLTCVHLSSISHVAGLMIDHKIDAVPVLDDEGGLVGLVTSTDLLELLREGGSESHKILPFRYELHNEVLRRRSATA